MVSITRLFLLNLHLLSHLVEASRQPTSKGTKWLQEGRSVLVRLDTPDLPLWNANEQIGEELPSALIFNFTLTQDSRTLLLNDVPILPLENAHFPPLLSARQTSVNSESFENDNVNDYSQSPIFDLDYSRRVSTPFSDHLEIDILGASIAGYNSLLPSNDQRYIHVYLQQVAPHGLQPAHKKLPSSVFKISQIRLDGRFLEFKHPDSLKVCRIWSWRCADIKEYPWYRYIYRQSFDAHGKIGSFRRFLHMRWENLRQKLGLWQAVVLLFVVGTMLALPFFYGIYELVRMVRDFYRQRQEDVDFWIADEELDSLLGDDDEERDSDKMDKETAVENGVGSGAQAEKPLPPLPHPTNSEETSNS